MKSVTHSIFKTFLLSVLVAAQVHFAYAQTASILPPAKTTFIDANGKPLTAGTVESFIPSTTTHKTTWQDAAETIPNANPLTLDAAGRALLLGSGTYRQLVKDRLGNVIWDQVTSSTGSGGGGPTATGDGDLVGTIKPWAGMTAPNQYAFTYGQEVSRTTLLPLYTAITSTQPAFCASGSPILSGLSDTTNFWIGMPVEITCVAAGFSVVVSKTSTTVNMAANANVTVNTSATFYPWGRGNGSTTFNLPDFRGIIPAGNNNMGGIASPNMTTPFFGTATPNATGAFGGNQNYTLIRSDLTNTSIIPTFTGTATGTLTSNQANVLFSSGSGDLAGSGSNSWSQGNVTIPSFTPAGTISAVQLNGGVTQTSFSQVQPTITTNYIIKITPDDNSATASGVTALGGMTGSIACGSGLSCTGNIIALGSSFIQPTSYPSNITSGHQIPYLDSDAQFGNFASQYPLGSVSPNPLMIGKAGSTIGSSTVGQTFKIVFTSAGLTGSPITITYTAIGGDTISTVATGLCALVNANAILHGLGGKPIFCQALGGGVFNLQYDAAYGSTGATPLTTATTGSTGTITLAGEQLPLDYIIFPVSRNTAPRPALTGDGIYAFDWASNDSTGVYNTHYAILGCSIKVATAGATRGLCDISTAGNSGAATGRFSIGEGVMLRDSAGALPTGGDLGPGILNAANEYALTGAAKFGPTLSPAALGANTNDWTPTGLVGATEIRFSVSSTGNTITGITAQPNGTVLRLRNIGANAAVFQDANAGSIAANRFIFSTSGGTAHDMYIGANESIGLIYDSIDSRWRLLYAPVDSLTTGFSITGALTPSQITSNQNDYAPTGLSTNTVLRLSTDALRNLTGLTATATNVYRILVNVGSFPLVLQNQNASSTAINRFDFNGADVTLLPSQSIVLWHDTTASRWKSVSGVGGSNARPSTQVFLSGTNATYTTGTGATWIEVELMGGGGGGAGSGTTPGAATAGGNTCWNTSGTACTTPLYQATGGALGTTAGGTAAGGGIAGSLTCNDSQTGGTGGGSSGVLPNVGGSGGMSRYGGAVATNPVSAAGTAAVTNTGGGGSGAGSSATANSGGGGGGGGWCYFIISNPAATYVYTIAAAGTAGTAGTGGVVGGAGATGKIRVIEHYN